MMHTVQHHYCAMYLKQIVLVPFCFHIFHILLKYCLSMVYASQSLDRLEVPMLILLARLLRRTTWCDGSFYNSTWAEDIPRYAPLRCTKDVCLLLSPKTCF